MPAYLLFPFHAAVSASRTRPRSRGRPVSYTSPALMRRAPARHPFALFSLLRARSRARRCPSRYNVSQGASPPSRAAPRESPRAFRNGAEARTTARSIFRAKGPRPSMRPAGPGSRRRRGNARRVDAARPRKGRMSPPRERPMTPPPRMRRRFTEVLTGGSLQDPCPRAGTAGAFLDFLLSGAPALLGAPRRPHLSNRIGSPIEPLVAIPIAPTLRKPWSLLAVSCPSVARRRRALAPAQRSRLDPAACTEPHRTHRNSCNNCIRYIAMFSLYTLYKYGEPYPHTDTYQREL